MHRRLKPHEYMPHTARNASRLADVATALGFALVAPTLLVGLGTAALMLLERWLTQ